MAVVIVEAVAIVLLTVLVSGLLRSHADILRALHQLGVDHEAGAGSDRMTGGLEIGRRPQPAGAPSMAAASGRTATDLTGISPTGEALRIAVTSVRHDTLLAFLTTGCSTCATFWRSLARSDVAVPGDARLVIVSHDAQEESVGRVQALAPEGVPVMMSSQAWDDYQVAYAPYFVYVSGPGGAIAGEGVAGSWDELASLLGQAIGDVESAGSSQTGRALRGGPSEDQDRVGRVDADLRGAGILPGDPQLYPVHLDTMPSPNVTDGGR